MLTFFFPWKGNSWKCSLSEKGTSTTNWLDFYEKKKITQLSWFWGMAQADFLDFGAAQRVPLSWGIEILPRYSSVGFLVCLSGSLGALRALPWNGILGVSLIHNWGKKFPKLPSTVESPKSPGFPGSQNSLNDLSTSKATTSESRGMGKWGVQSTLIGKLTVNHLAVTKSLKHM